MISNDSRQEANLASERVEFVKIRSSQQKKRLFKQLKTWASELVAISRTTKAAFRIREFILIFLAKE
jgi:hypothetical protein